MLREKNAESMENLSNVIIKNGHKFKGFETKHGSYDAVGEHNATPFKFSAHSPKCHKSYITRI